MTAVDALATLQELGSMQRGLVTTSQAEAHGVSRVALGRLRDRGLIHQARRGVYALPTTGDDSLQDLHAAWLSTDPTKTADHRLRHPDIVVSYISAARIHGLGDVVAPVHEFTASARKRSSQPDVRIHHGDLPEDDVTVIESLPVTSIPRTVGDLADEGVDLDHLAEIVRDALSAAHVRPADLSRRLDGAAKRHGLTDGAALVEACLERAGLPAVAHNLMTMWPNVGTAWGEEAVRGLVQDTMAGIWADRWKHVAADLGPAEQGNLPPWMFETIRMPAFDGARQQLSEAILRALPQTPPWRIGRPDDGDTCVPFTSDEVQSDGDEEA